MYDPAQTQDVAASFDHNNNNNMPESNNIIQENVNAFSLHTNNSQILDHNFNNNNNMPENVNAFLLDTNNSQILDHNFNNNNNMPENVNAFSLDTNNSQILDHNFNNNTNNIHTLSSHEMMYQNFDDNITNNNSNLLTLLHLPTPSISFVNNKSTSPPPLPAGLTFLGGPELNPNMMHENESGLGYDPLFHLNLPPQPSPLLRDLMFQSYPNGNNCPTFFGHMEDGEGSNNGSMNMNVNGFSGLYQDNNNNIGEHNMMMQQNGNNIFEFTSGASLDDGKLGGNNSNKSPKNFVTERQRRQNFNDKYKTLQGLIPTPTKADRASIVHDAIRYIEELKRSVDDLKLLAQKKRNLKERNKRLKTENNNNPANSSDNGVDHNNNGPQGVEVKPDPDEAFIGSTDNRLRSSWLQRKCKDTEVDVRIVDDEVTIKLVQRKKVDCLLSVSRTLDDLQLDLRHVAGGHVGDYYSYLFNSKISEGSSVYASAIANKLIEVVERNYAAASVNVAPTSSY